MILLTMKLLDKKDTGVLVIDVQEKLMEVMGHRERVTDNIVKLLRLSELFSLPVMVTEQYPKGLGPTLPDIVAKLPSEQTAYEKTCFSSCGATGIEKLLNDAVRKQIIITGMETHICVLQSAIELQQQGKQVFVVQDAVCSRSKKHFKNALARMQQAGIIISNTESVLFEWLKDASHPQFKTLAKLIR